MITEHADMASWMACETNGLAYQCLSCFPLAYCELGMLSLHHYIYLSPYGPLPDYNFT